MIVNGSNDAAADMADCGSAAAVPQLPDRCGYGQRLPLLVISPFAGKLRRQHPDRPDLDRRIHRGQLARRQRIGHGSYDASRRLVPLGGMLSFGFSRTSGR